VGERNAPASAQVHPSSSVLRAAPAAGQRVGHYVVERTIGSGGMGIVVSARHEQIGELVAIKLLHPRVRQDVVQIQRFVREARSTARIKSEHVVRVLDAGVQESTGTPYIVMEHLSGQDLGQVLAEKGPLHWQIAVEYVVQACEAVASAHAVGIIHRDLKPSNLFVTQRADGTPLVKVLDFGISKAIVEEGAPDPRLTETQAVFGSPTYMSPEQIRSAKNVDARSDVWSLGVALYELVTGKLPFMADNVAGLLASIVADPPYTPTAFAPMPPELEQVILRCLEKDPARRIASAGELAVRLRPFVSLEGRVLADRVERITGSGGLPAATRVSVVPPRPSGPAPPVAIGTTGTDLSQVTPAGPGGAARAILVAAAAVVTTVVVIVAWLVARGAAPPPTLAASAPGSAVSASASGSAAASASAAASGSAAASESAAAAAPASTRAGGHRPRTVHTAPAGHKPGPADDRY
jgi:hypothetical protein